MNVNWAAAAATMPPSAEPPPFWSTYSHRQNTARWPQFLFGSAVCSAEMRKINRRNNTQKKTRWSGSATGSSPAAAHAFNDQAFGIWTNVMNKHIHSRMCCVCSCLDIRTMLAMDIRWRADCIGSHSHILYIYIFIYMNKWTNEHTYWDTRSYRRCTQNRAVHGGSTTSVDWQDRRHRLPRGTHTHSDYNLRRQWRK